MKAIVYTIVAATDPDNHHTCYEFSGKVDVPVGLTILEAVIRACDWPEELHTVFLDYTMFPVRYVHTGGQNGDIDMVEEARALEFRCDPSTTHYFSTAQQAFRMLQQNGVEIVDEDGNDLTSIYDPAKLLATDENKADYKATSEQWAFVIDTLRDHGIRATDANVERLESLLEK